MWCSGINLVIIHQIMLYFKTDYFYIYSSKPESREQHLFTSKLYVFMSFICVYFPPFSGCIFVVQFHS